MSMIYSCGHVSESAKVCPICGKGKPMIGKEAYERGRNHTDSVYQESGTTHLRGWLRYKPSNDYEKGRRDRAEEILQHDGDIAR